MKLKELLNQLKYHVSPDPDAMYNEIVGTRKEKRSPKAATIIKSICFAVIGTALIIGLGFYIRAYFTYNDAVNIVGDTANLSEIVFVETDPTTATVSVATRKPMSISEVKECISITPEASFTVRKKGINSFALTFSSELEQGVAYSINSMVADTVVYRWSLQQKNDFAIVSSTPSIKTEVDINTAIEIVFSESGVNGLEQYFSITPKVDGNFVHNGRTWIFAPTQALDPYTVYTVTVSGSIVNTQGVALGEDYSFTFTTGASEDRWAYIVNKTFDIADTFSSAVAPNICIRSKGISAATADMTVYRIADSEQYINLHNKYNANPIVSTAIKDDIEQAALAVHSQFSVSVITDPQNNELHYMSYPKELESGYYVTEVVWNDITLYQLLQISDLAVQITAYNGDYAVWVNNTQTGLAVPNANVSIEGVDAVTDENGIATLSPKLSAESNGTFVTVEYDTLLPYVLYAENVQNVKTNSNYYTYFYTDRTFYNVGDTIKVWGIALSRNASVSKSDIKLVSAENGIECPIEPDENGIFSLDIPTTDLNTGDVLNLILKIDQHDYKSKTLYICEDQDIISLDVSAPKYAYFSGESAAVNITAEHSDGTPAVGQSITGETDLTTDDNGNAQYAKTLSASTGRTDPAPEVQTLKFATDGTAYSLPLLVFNSSEYLQVDLNQTDAGYSLNIQTNKVTLDKINSLSLSEYLDIYDNIDPQYFVGDAINKEIVLEIHDVTYARESAGSYYDPNLQKIQFKYKYTEQDAVLSTQVVSTSNGILSYENFSIPSATGYRYLKVKMTDSNGKACEKKIYIDQPITSSSDQYEFLGKNSAAIGQEITLNICDPSTKQKFNDGLFVCHIVGDTILESKVSSDATVSFVFDERYSSGITVYGAYFDGTHLHAVAPHTITQDTTDKELFVTVQTDKAKYPAGETVTATIAVTDIDGKPAKASYNISLSDSALLGINSASEDILSELYAYNTPDNVYSSSPITYESDTSSNDTQTNTNFIDTNVFLSGKTAKDGTATVEFAAPQGVANWTLSVQVLGEDATAGHKVTEIATYDNFYLSYQAIHTANSTDDIILPYICKGAALTDNTPVTGKITVYRNEDTVWTSNIQHNAGEFQRVNIGKLIAGNYTVIIEATNGTDKDSIEYSFIVKDTVSYSNYLTDYASENGTPKALLLTDTEFSTYVDVFEQLLNSTGTQIDSAAARTYARSLLDGYADWSILSDYIKKGGYAAHATDSEPNLIISACMASLFAEQVNREELIGYFDAVFIDTDAKLEEILCALWGKAALHQSIEDDLDYYYTSPSTLTYEQLLYFALGYAYSGNHTMANTIYTEQIRPHIAAGLIDDTFISESDTLSYLLKILLTRISSKDVTILPDDPTKFAAINYIKEFVPAIEGENAVLINFEDGSEVTVTYPRCAAYYCKIEAETSIVSIEQTAGVSIIKANYDLSPQKLSTLGTRLGAIPCTLPETVTLGSEFAITLTLDPATLQGNPVYLALPSGINYKNFAAIYPDSGIQTQASSAVTVNNSVLEIQTDFDTTVNLLLYCKAEQIGNRTLQPIVCITDNALTYYASDSIAFTVSATPTEVPDEIAQ